MSVIFSLTRAGSAATSISCLLSRGNCLIISHAVRWKSWALTLLPLFFPPRGPNDLLRGFKAWSGSGESHLLISFNTLVSGCVCVWFRIPSSQNRQEPGDRGGRLTAVIFTGIAALKCSFLKNHQGWFIWERISFTCGCLSPRQLGMEEANALSCKGH